MTIVTILIALLVLGAVASLIYGLVLMASGGGESSKDNMLRQNKMMTYRIWFQAAAIIVLVLVFYFTKK